MHTTMNQYSVLPVCGYSGIYTSNRLRLLAATGEQECEMDTYLIC